ncbi:MAG: fructosamine kinase family protein, partial [Methyloligellaceae bacterium]
MAWEEVEARISEAIGARFRARRRRCVSGGCINDAHVVSGDGRTYFVKTNECAAIEMFRAEAEGLAQLAGTGELRVPRPVCTGSSDEFAYLVVEHLALRD